MTIREHFERDFKRIKNVTVGVTIALCVAMTVFFPQLNRLQTVAAVLLIAAAVSGGLMLVTRRRYLCPRCGADLGRLQGEQWRGVPFTQRLTKMDRRMFWQVWDACPKCAVSFGEDYGPISR